MKRHSPPGIQRIKTAMALADASRIALVAANRSRSPSWASRWFAHSVAYDQAALARLFSMAREYNVFGDSPWTGLEPCYSIGRYPTEQITYSRRALAQIDPLEPEAMQKRHAAILNTVFNFARTLVDGVDLEQLADAIDAHIKRSNGDPTKVWTAVRDLADRKIGESDE